MKRLSDNMWVLIIVAAFAVVYAQSLTFVYVEGDDASTIAYHALGRNFQLQPPYSSYHAGMDVLLRVLPAREPLLRIGAITLSAAGAALMVILMLDLIFDWLQERSARVRSAVALVTLLACPEFFYLGLVYTPTVVAMCFTLASHLLLRRRVVNGAALDGGNRVRWGAIALSAALFGFGVACRWDVLLYGLVILTDCIAGRWIPILFARQGFSRLAVSLTVWGAVSLIVFVSAVASNGYGIHSVVGVAQTTAELPGGKHVDLAFLVMSVCNLQTLFTPVFVLLFLVGLVKARDEKRWLAAVGIAAVAFCVLVMKWNVPKLLIAFLPLLLVCMASGWRDLFHNHQHSGQRFIPRAVVVALMIAPWALGLHATYGETAWGPGFELRPYDSPQAGTTARIVVGGGAACPTQEGPRPLFGHAVVLLGGQWRELVAQLESERRAAIGLAVRQKIPFLILQGSNGYAVAELCDMGLSTTDNKGFRATSLLGEIRRFNGSDGKKTLLMTLKTPVQEMLEERGHVREILDVAGERVVVHGYPSTLRNAYRASPHALEKLGPTTGILSLAEVHDALAPPEIPGESHPAAQLSNKDKKRGIETAAAERGTRGYERQQMVNTQ